MVDAWRSVPGASEFLIRTEKYRIYDPSVTPFLHGTTLSSVSPNSGGHGFCLVGDREGSARADYRITEEFSLSCVVRGLLFLRPLQLGRGMGKTEVEDSLSTSIDRVITSGQGLPKWRRYPSLPCKRPKTNSLCHST